ncbi:MAG: hypothetical protein AAFU41_00690 [Pseudomonadota bacterium]
MSALPAIAHVAKANGGDISDETLAYIEDIATAWQNGRHLDPASRHLIKLTLPQLMRELYQHRMHARELLASGPQQRLAAQ